MMHTRFHRNDSTTFFTATAASTNASLDALILFIFLYRALYFESNEKRNQVIHH